MLLIKNRNGAIHIINLISNKTNNKQIHISQSGDRKKTIVVRQWIKLVSNFIEYNKIQKK